eukprot:1450518-Amphidinium_carterae.1
MQEAHQTPISCRKYVPKGARTLWSQCVTGALNQIAEYNDDRAWTEYFMLTKCVLPAPARTGTNHRKRNEMDTKDLCRRWLEGQRESLWEGRKGKRKHSQQAKEPPSLQERMERANAMLEEGLLLRKACAALVDGQLEGFTDEVHEEMQKKHPEARGHEAGRLAGLRKVSAAAAPEIQRGDVMRALRSFPKGSAPGPCGLKPQHLKDAVTPGFQEAFEIALGKVMDLIIKGRVPESVRPWLFGANLVALRKPAGGLRPIA